MRRSLAASQPPGYWAHHEDVDPGYVGQRATSKPRRDSDFSDYGSLGSSRNCSNYSALGISVVETETRSSSPQHAPQSRPDSRFSDYGSLNSSPREPKPQLFGARPMLASLPKSSLSTNRSYRSSHQNVEKKPSCSEAVPVSRPAENRQLLPVPYITLQEPTPRLLSLSSPDPANSSELLTPLSTPVMSRNVTPNPNHRQEQPFNVESNKASLFRRPALRRAQRPTTAQSQRPASIQEKPLPPPHRNSMTIPRKPVPPPHDEFTILSRKSEPLRPESPPPTRKRVQAAEKPASFRANVASRPRRMSVSQSSEPVNKDPSLKSDVFSRARRISFCKSNDKRATWGSYGAPLGGFT